MGFVIFSESARDSLAIVLSNFAPMPGARVCAGKTLANAAIALIDDPALVQKARQEHEERAVSGYVCPIEPDAVPVAI